MRDTGYRDFRVAEFFILVRQPIRLAGWIKYLQF